MNIRASVLVFSNRPSKRNYPAFRVRQFERNTSATDAVADFKGHGALNSVHLLKSEHQSEPNVIWDQGQLAKRRSSHHPLEVSRDRLDDRMSLICRQTGDKVAVPLEKR